MTTTNLLVRTVGKYESSRNVQTGKDQNVEEAVSLHEACKAEQRNDRASTGFDRARNHSVEQRTLIRLNVGQLEVVNNNKVLENQRDVRVDRTIVQRVSEQCDEKAEHLVQADWECLPNLVPFDVRTTEGLLTHVDLARLTLFHGRSGTTLPGDCWVRGRCKQMLLAF